MAVPKKKLSKSKRDIRRSVWNRKITDYVLLALSLGKLNLNSKSGSFVFPSSLEN